MEDKEKGFTLIEVLVVLGVTILLSSVIITYSSESREQILLGIEKAKLVQVISKAKSLSISTYNQPDVPCGYGVVINIEERTYQLFRHKTTPCASIRTEGIEFAPGDLDPADLFSLPQNIRFEKQNGAMEIVFFMPPDPVTLIWVDGERRDEGSIFLKTSKDEAVIKVSGAGQITF